MLSELLLDLVLARVGVPTIEAALSVSSSFVSSHAALLGDDLVVRVLDFEAEPPGDFAFLDEPAIVDL